MAEPVTYPIGVVSSLTGLSTHVLRAWERRYRAVSPQRSASGRRLYVKADIDRLILLKRVLKGGHGISHVAGLETAQLTELALLGAADPVADAAPAYSHADDQPERLGTPIEDCLQAVGALDARRLQRMLTGMTASCSRQFFLEAIIRPFMAEVGHRWSDGSLRIVHGQLASAVVHTMLAGMLDDPADGQADRPRMLIATPAGQRCYLGALAAAVTAQDCGWEPVFVGFDLPADEIVAAHVQIAPQLTALSITCQSDGGDLGDDIEHLAAALNPPSELIVGGRASQFYLEKIEAVGGTVCSTIADLARRIN